MSPPHLIALQIKNSEFLTHKKNWTRDKNYWII